MTLKELKVFAKARDRMDGDLLRRSYALLDIRGHSDISTVKLRYYELRYNEKLNITNLKSISIREKISIIDAVDRGDKSKQEIAKQVNILQFKKIGRLFATLNL